MQWFVGFGSTAIRQFGRGVVTFTILSWLLTGLAMAQVQDTPDPEPIRPTSVQAIAEQADELDLTDFHFVLDRSGSLKETDPTGGRYEAIRMLSRIVTDQDGLSLRLFDENVQSIGIPGSSGDERWNDILTTLRNEGSSGRYTDIENGLETAFRQINPKHRSAVVLLTDGLIDLPNQDQVLPSRTRLLNDLSQKFRKSGAFLFVVGFGPNGDNEFLKDLAKRSGGVMVQVNNEKNITKRFLELFERVKKPQSVEVKGDTFYIDGMVKEVTLILETPESDEELSIKTPTGAVLTPNDANGDKLTWARSNLYHIVSIKAPVVGTWKVVTNTRKRVRIHLLTDLKLIVRLSDSQPTAGQPVGITTYLTAKNQQVDNLILRRSTQHTCRLLDESGREITPMLLQPDTTRGIHTGSFTAPQTPASYKLSCLAKNPVFNRTQTVYVDVGRGPFVTAAVAKLNDKQIQVALQLKWGFNSPVGFAGGKVFWSHEGAAASGALKATGMSNLQAVVNSEKSLPPAGYVEGTWVLPDQQQLPMELQVPFMQNGMMAPGLAPGAQANLQAQTTPQKKSSGNEWMLVLAVGIMISSAVGFGVMKWMERQNADLSMGEFEVEGEEVTTKKNRGEASKPNPMGDLSSFDPPSLDNSAQNESLDDSIRDLSDAGEPSDDKWYGKLEDSLQKLEQQRGGSAQAPAAPPVEEPTPPPSQAVNEKQYDDLAASLAQLEQQTQEAQKDPGPAAPEQQDTEPEQSEAVGSLADTLARLEAEVEQNEASADSAEASGEDGQESLEAMLARMEREAGENEAIPEEGGVDEAYAGLEDALNRMEEEENGTADSAEESKAEESASDDDESLADMIARLEDESGEAASKMMENDESLAELEAALARMEEENGIEPPPPKAPTPAVEPDPIPEPAPEPIMTADAEASTTSQDGQESMEDMLARLEAESAQEEARKAAPPEPTPDSSGGNSMDDFRNSLAALEAQVESDAKPKARKDGDSSSDKDGEERHAYVNLKQSLDRLTAQAEDNNEMFSGLDASLAELERELSPDDSTADVDDKLAALERDMNSKPPSMETTPAKKPGAKTSGKAAKAKAKGQAKNEQESLDDLMAEFDRATKEEVSSRDGENAKSGQFSSLDEQIRQLESEQNNWKAQKGKTFS